MTILNIISQAIKPKRLIIMAKKIFLRFFDQEGTLSHSDNLNWLESNCIVFEDYAKAIDPYLWENSKKVCEKIKFDAKTKLKKIKYDLGGGGFYPLLYFLVSLKKPKIIIETGVAAGYSSYAILKAIENNGMGRLYSSDFPYFRIPNPEKYIGIIVPEKLKKSWNLFIDGDNINLPLISKKIHKIDVLHYDSDKSYIGRKHALNLLKNNMDSSTTLIMDDIQDNSFFYDYILKLKNSKWYIFKFEGKYIGFIEGL